MRASWREMSSSPRYCSRVQPALQKALHGHGAGQGDLDPHAAAAHGDGGIGAVSAPVTRR